MSSADLDLAEGLDGLQQDMAEHQRLTGKTPTAEANRALAAATIERLERELADERPVAATAPIPAPVATETIERKEGAHGTYFVGSTPSNDVKVRAARPAESWFLEHAMPRIELLMTKRESGPLGAPSWRDRVMAVMKVKLDVQGLRMGSRFNPLLHADADVLERRFMFELCQLLEESSATFGDWKKSPDRKLVFG